MADRMKAGIITIHKINNYGSVLQAYALQHACESMGVETEIIDYDFPNGFHANNKYALPFDSSQNEPKWMKLLFAPALMRQHHAIQAFVSEKLKTSEREYDSPGTLKSNPPVYDIYITGSDQVWNPRYCNGDPSFMLHFAPDNAKRISFGSSVGGGSLPEDLVPLYREYLRNYNRISVREQSGVKLLGSITGRNDIVKVVDPTLLLDRSEWNEYAVQHRLVRNKYILCYFLNYTFDAFPYVDELAEQMKRTTGYEIVRIARPPHKLGQLRDRTFVGASLPEFLALVRDAELVLTTSFHGTAFALNFGKPVFTIVQDKSAGDNRQLDLMRDLGLESKVISVGDTVPEFSDALYDFAAEQDKLKKARIESINFLKEALKNG